jgi:iron complex transport system substrate-binding protein
MVATSACSSKQPSSPQVVTETGDTPSSSQTISVSDRLQRTVQFSTAPKRVVSLSPAITELMYAIGAGTQLVGATKYCNYPSEANDIPRVGAGTLESLSRETIVSLNPDLVLCKWDTHEPLVESLDELGIPTLAVGADSLEQLFDEISLLASVMRTTSQAESLVDSMKTRLEKLSAVTESIPASERVSVFYEVWHEPLMTAGPDSFIGELLKIAGMRNIFDDTTQRYPKVSSEVVVHRNPDVILAPSTHATEVNIEAVMARQGWEGVQAVRDKKIFLIDGDQVSRCGPRLLEALEQMIRAVYPERWTIAEGKIEEGKPVEP